MTYRVQPDAVLGTGWHLDTISQKHHESHSWSQVTALPSYRKFRSFIPKAFGEKDSFELIHVFFMLIHVGRELMEVPPIALQKG